MFVLRVFICLFLLSLIHVGQAKACSVGDDCTPKPCQYTVDFFGAYSEKSAEYNYRYYDAILVIQPMWGFEEYMAAPIKDQDNFSRKPFSGRRFSEAPYQVVEEFKVLDASGRSSDGVMTLSSSASEYFTYPIKYLASNLLPKERDVCLDAFSFSNYRDPSQENQFLVFVKKYKEAKTPVIVRLKHIKKHAYEPNKKEAREADLVFSAVLETVKKQGKTPEKVVRKYKDVQILKKAEVLGAGAVFTEHEPLFGLIKDEIEIRAAITSSIKFPIKIGEYVQYPYPQRNIYYYKQNTEYEDLYELIHVSEDIEWELEQLRKIKSQE